MIFCFLTLVESVVLSIDLGSESMRASNMVRGQPVSIVLNGEGRRYTPAVAALLPIDPDAPAIITEEDVRYFKRSHGDFKIATRYPMNSTRFLPQLLGKNYSNKLVSYFLKKNLTMPFDMDDEKYLELVAPPEFFASQLISSAVADIKRTKVNLTVDDLVLVIPKFLTHHQRKAYINSAKLATYKPYLIDTSMSVGALFSVEKSNLFKEKPLIVGFIDIGASQVEFSIQEFSTTKDGINIIELGYSYCDYFGGQTVDVAIGKEIRKEVERLYPDAVIDNRIVQNIMAGARKVKHELTLMPELSLFLEDILPGIDITFRFSQEKLKQIFQKELKILSDTIVEGLHSAGFEDPEDIERIELIGGASRIPILIDSINETFKFIVPILRTLNAEEANVIGAGYAVAAAKGGFLSNAIKFNSIDPYKIDVLSGRVTTFVYANGQKLPIGIKPFIRTVDMGQKGSYEIKNGIVVVHGAKKLSKSGLYRDKRFRIERILQVFEDIEKEKAAKEKILHDFDTFLLDSRENITKDSVVVETSTVEERNNALKIIAQIQYIMQRDQITDEKELKRLRTDVEEVTKPILKKAEEKKELPKVIKALKEAVDTINRAVKTDWPQMGMKPKKKLLIALGKMMSRADKTVQQYEEGSMEKTYNDIIILFENLKRAFDKVKDNLESKNSREL